jgi:hypothetical protein
MGIGDTQTKKGLTVIGQAYLYLSLCLGKIGEQNKHVVNWLHLFN